MVYLSIDDMTSESKALVAELQKKSFVTIHKSPNAITLKALKDAKEGKTKPIKDVAAWLKDLTE